MLAPTELTRWHKVDWTFPPSRSSTWPSPRTPKRGSQVASATPGQASSILDRADESSRGGPV